MCVWGGGGGGGLQTETEVRRRVDECRGRGEGILWVLLVAAVSICCYKTHIGSCQSVFAASGSLQVPM